MTDVILALPDISTLLEMGRTTPGKIVVAILTLLLIAFAIAQSREKTTGEVLTEWGMSIWSLGGWLFNSFVYGIGSGLLLMGKGAGSLGRWIADNTEVKITIPITPKSITAVLALLGLIGTAEVTGLIDVSSILNW